MPLRLVRHGFTSTASILLCVCAPVLAQLKVGSNPTTLNTAYNLQVEADSGAQLVVNKTDGNVGVGLSNASNTAAPQARLEVQSGTSGSSGMRLTNLAKAAVLATNSSGDIVAGTTTAPSDTNLPGCTCGDIKMVLSASAGTSVATQNGYWKLMDGTQSISASCTVPTTNLTSKLLVMDGGVTPGTLGSVATLQQNQLPDVSIRVGVPLVSGSSGPSGYNYAGLTNFASGSDNSYNSTSLNTGVTPLTLTPNLFARVSVNYYVCVTN